MPLLETSGKTGAAEPSQKAGIGENVGIVRRITNTVKICELAHWFASGVKRYVPDIVLLTTAGDHVPTIPFGDVVASIGAGVPSQKLGIGAKSGAVIGVMVTVVTKVGVLTHSFAAAVNV